MKDIELECLPHWRYCRINRGEKGPRYSGWQHQPLTLDRVLPQHNIGILLGPHSGGVVALDFDGASAWDKWDELFNCEIPDTVSWSSGRAGRCQMAFSVEEQFWPYLPNRIAVAAADGEMLEFRWRGVQSVLPPSIHPGTGLPYFWILPPSTTAVAPLPDAVLEWAVSRHIGDTQPDPHYKPIDASKLTEDEYQGVDDHLRRLQRHKPVLSYDEWLRVTGAVARTMGGDVAAVMMNTYWPEQHRGEYRHKIRSLDPARSPTMGTVVKMIRDHEPGYFQKGGKSRSDERIKRTLELVKNKYNF